MTRTDMRPRRGKLLFVGLDYHDYTRELAREFEKLGNEVSFHSIQPRTPGLQLARRVSTERYRAKLSTYHNSITDRYDDDYFDTIVFLQTHQFSIENLERLRSKQSSAKFILYNWDAVGTHDYRRHLRLFDAAFTFDPIDAEELGIGYLPLFCLRRFQDRCRRTDNAYSVYSIGNVANPVRHRAVSAFACYCASHGIAFDYFLSASLHGLTEVIKSGTWPFDISLLNISSARFMEMMDKASATFDFANHRQSGFTMRTIENLCAGKKIITNNRNVLAETFYSSDRFLVFEDMDFSGVKAFLETPIQNPEERFQDFWIQTFATRLLGGHG